MAIQPTKLRRRSSPAVATPAPRRVLCKPRLLAVMALGTIMAGCAGLAPRYTGPPLPVATHYPDDAGTGPGGVAVTAAWRDYFTDPRLQELIARSLDYNRDLRVAALRIQETRALYGVQRADLFPAVSADAYALRSRVSGGQSRDFRLSQVGLNLSGWEIDFWGRVRNLKDEARQNYFASEESRRAVTVSLIAQVADTYFIIRALDERIALARQTIASREESFRIFTRRVEVGSTSRLDLTQVEELLRQAQLLGAQLEQERAMQAHALTLLVGESVDLAVVRERFQEEGVLPELRAGLPSELLLSRPDILAAEHRLRAAHANIGAARAAFFPRVTLIGSTGTASAELSGLFSSPGLFESGSGAWTFLPSISLPIFNAGRNRNNLNLAQVRRNSAVAQYEKTVQTAFRDVSDALSARHWLMEQVRIQETALAAQTERVRLATLRYNNGSASFLEVLDAQREVLSGEQQLVQIRQALLSSRVGLYAALGGGA
jgi:outer membrane protein, multidrug efflux system